MIPVTKAPEPSSFDVTVRQKGKAAIDEMVGRTPSSKRSGPRRKKIAEHESDIPSDKFPPYWRDSLPELREAYESRCAFLAMYIEPATGNPSVDHMIPKSCDWSQVYEWSNYRLCSAGVNAKKQDNMNLVDPFVCKVTWFALNFTSFEVVEGAKAPRNRSNQISETLRLVNGAESCKLREEYCRNYSNKHIDLEYLTKRAPFIASELARQEMSFT